MAGVITIPAVTLLGWPVKTSFAGVAGGWVDDTQAPPANPPGGATSADPRPGMEIARPVQLRLSVTMQYLPGTSQIVLVESTLQGENVTRAAEPEDLALVARRGPPAPAKPGRAALDPGEDRRKKAFGIQTMRQNN